MGLCLDLLRVAFTRLFVVRVTTSKVRLWFVCIPGADACSEFWLMIARIRCHPSRLLANETERVRIVSYHDAVRGWLLEVLELTEKYNRQ